MGCNRVFAGRTPPRAVVMPGQTPFADCRAWALVTAAGVRRGHSAGLRRQRRHHSKYLLLDVHVRDAPSRHPLLWHAALQDVVSKQVICADVAVAGTCELQNEVVVVRPCRGEVENLALNVLKQCLRTNHRAPTTIQRPRGQDRMHLETLRQKVIDRSSESLCVSNRRCWSLTVC